jgi:acetyl esterase/lipase
MQARIILYLLLFATFFTGCTHKEAYVVTPIPSLPTRPFIFLQNLLYGTDTVQQTLDVDLPITRDTVNTPVIILIHGGAWIQGEKEDFTGLGLDTFFTANSCAVVNMNYRLDGTYKYPAPLDDVGLVLDFIKQNASAWHINPNRICLLGKSSGSQLALLYAYSRNQDKRVKAVIDGFGPTDFTDTSVVNGNLNVNVTVWLGPYPANAPLWQAASPINYMSGCVPTVIIQGTEDVEVDPIQSLMLQDSLTARGMPNLFISWTGDGHGWDLVKWAQDKDQVMSWIKGFL